MSLTNLILAVLLILALAGTLWRIAVLNAELATVVARAAQAQHHAAVLEKECFQKNMLTAQLGQTLDDLRTQLDVLQKGAQAEENKLLLRIAELERDKHAMECTMATSRAMHEIERQRAALPSRPARFSLEAALPEESIAELLAGTAALPTMRAVFAHVSAEIVRLSDRSTDEPRDTVVLPDRIIPGYGADQRLHDAGGASHLAALLAKLQDLTKPRPQNQEQQPAAA